ncbi:phosphotransferase enzyme family protein [Candidatus Uabimicrobium amorphum]|uniref:Homoserine kinase n=1 Tax=Uabimicrobium amorphum TaxID=2596890 RepID=A0A5S9INB6_UABAM|nr:phosphotransferase [Candidatus Uabimicrobium amorphum]BBM83715.1 homoserine kinase [Candidatus Uabimicrobium amorphum]
MHKLIEDNYSIGKVTKIEKHCGGCINDNYVVTTADKRYFWRAYNTKRSQEDIAFEHSLLCYLQEIQFSHSSPLVYTKAQQTYIYDNDRYYALFGFLNDRVVYNWDEDCSLAHLESAALLQARYHQAVHEWNPVHPRKISWEAFFDKLRQKIVEKRSYNTLLTPHRKHLIAQTNHTSCFLKSIAKLSLPKIVIHGDYHPENVMFNGEKATAVLDFDWCIFFYRIFDVALAMFYFCCSWSDHTLCSKKCEAYLKNYENILTLSPEEHQVLDDFFIVARLYLLKWLLDDYDRLSTQQQIKYLEHFCHFH